MVSTITAQKPMAQVNIEELERQVKKMYSDVADHPEVAYHFEMGRKLAERLGYNKVVLDRIPQEAIDSFAGVGNVFEMAELKEGDVVLDLGSGSGMDTFYAAIQVGKTGEVYGVEMTDAQLEKARKLKAKGAFDHTYFIDGHIESLPIISNTIDTVISNGVINLSSKKKNVFKEAARVLKPGGKLLISDIISKKQLPESISADASLWAACIGGALEINEYTNYIRHAGFEIQAIKENPYAFISSSTRAATKKYGIGSVTILAIKQ
jgi:arsenite methyltransferase